MKEEPSISGDPTDGSGGELSLPDEIWEQFERDTEGGIRTSAPRSLSGRARMVGAQLRREDVSVGFGVKGRKARKKVPAGPPGWRTGPAWQEMNGRAARRRRVRGALGVLAAVAVAVVALNPSGVLSLLPGDTGSSPDSTGRGSGAPSPLPLETAAPTAAPSFQDDETPTLKEPFRGSPAAQYADGAAGIVAPEAAPVASLSKDQVAAALSKTRELLIDANVNPRTLRGARPAEALGLVDPGPNDVLDQLNTSLRRPGKEHDPLVFFSRFDRKQVRLVGDVVKTRGRMTFQKNSEGGVDVHADYTFVYPLVKAVPGAQEVARTIVRRILDVRVSDPDESPYRLTPGKLTVVRFDQELANSSCDVYDGYLHPEFLEDTRRGPSPTGPTVDPYDRSGPATRHPEGCGSVSRT